MEKAEERLRFIKWPNFSYHNLRMLMIYAYNTALELPLYSHEHYTWFVRPRLSSPEISVNSSRMYIPKPIWRTDAILKINKLYI